MCGFCPNQNCLSVCHLVHQQDALELFNLERIQARWLARLDQVEALGGVCKARIHLRWTHFICLCFVQSCGLSLPLFLNTAV